MSTDATTDATTDAAELPWAGHLTALGSAVGSALTALRDSSGEATVVLDGPALEASRPRVRLGPVDADEAAQVLADLHDLLAELEAARSRVGRELQLHRRLAAGRSPDAGAVYLDGRC